MRVRCPNNPIDWRRGVPQNCVAVFPVLEVCLSGAHPILQMAYKYLFCLLNL